MDEDMDSLFEGMILITPTNQLDSDRQTDPPPKSESSVASNDNDDPSSQPLDENLFSDLTLVTNSPQESATPDHSSPSTSTTPQTPPPPVLSRQLSTTTRKKKRAAGLRIGYGRVSSSATSTVSDDSPTSSPASNSIRNIAAADDENGQDEYGNEDNSRNNGRLSDGVKPPEQEEESTSFAPIGIEQRFEQIKDRISEKLRIAQEAVASVSDARKDAIKRRRKASENLIQASEKYKDLERELEEACEAEDFEKADRVSQSLSSADNERELLVASLRNAEADCDALDSKMLLVLENQIQAEEECASLLNNFAVDAAGNADLVRSNAEAMFSKEMQEWLSSTEAVDMKKIELEIESHLIHEARSGLNNSLEEIAGDDHRERDILYKKKAILTEELEKLLALVKEKEAEIAENNYNIDKVEARISSLDSGFEEVQSSVDMKYNNLQSDLLKIEMENETLSKRKEEIDARVLLEEHRGSKILELSRNSLDEANKYLEDVGLRRSLLQLIIRYKEDKDRLAKMEEKLSEDVQSLKHEIAAARAYLQELSSTKSSIQQETESIKQRLIFIDKRTPELEAEKKVAASARNFKEAARIAAEAKGLSVEREELQAQAESMVLDLKKLEEKMSITIDVIHETEQQMASKEKDLAMARFRRLTLVSGSAAAERSAALELGDIGEADMLLGETESANAEARKLQSVYDIKDEEIAALPKSFVSVELVSKLGGKQLEGLAVSAQILGSKQ